MRIQSRLQDQARYCGVFRRTVTSYGTGHGAGTLEDITIPWLAIGPNVPAGLTLTENIMVFDTAATALYALEPDYPGLKARMQQLGLLQQ